MTDHDLNDHSYTAEITLARQQVSRYRNDPMFNRLVDTLLFAFKEASVTPEDARQALAFAEALWRDELQPEAAFPSRAGSYTAEEVRNEVDKALSARVDPTSASSGHEFMNAEGKWFTPRPASDFETKKDR